jgi:peptidyl-tRNA hydrolase
MFLMTVIEVINYLLTYSDILELDSPLKMNQVNDSKTLAMGKVEVQPETLTCSSTSPGLDSWPPDNPQIQTRCSRAVEGST